MQGRAFDSITYLGNALASRPMVTIDSYNAIANSIGSPAGHYYQGLICRGTRRCVRFPWNNFITQCRSVPKKGWIFSAASV